MDGIKDMATEFITDTTRVALSKIIEPYIDYATFGGLYLIGIPVVGKWGSATFAITAPMVWNAGITAKMLPTTIGMGLAGFTLGNHFNYHPVYSGIAGGIGFGLGVFGQYKGYLAGNDILALGEETLAWLHPKWIKNPMTTMEYTKIWKTMINKGVSVIEDFELPINNPNPTLMESVWHEIGFGSTYTKREVATGYTYESLVDRYKGLTSHMKLKNIETKMDNLYTYLYDSRGASSYTRHEQLDIMNQALHNVTSGAYDYIPSAWDLKLSVDEDYIPIGLFRRKNMTIEYSQHNVTEHYKSNPLMMESFPLEQWSPLWIGGTLLLWGAVAFSYYSWYNRENVSKRLEIVHPNYGHDKPRYITESTKKLIESNIDELSDKIKQPDQIHPYTLSEFKETNTSNFAENIKRFTRDMDGRYLTHICVEIKFILSEAFHNRKIDSRTIKVEELNLIIEDTIKMWKSKMDAIFYRVKYPNANFNLPFDNRRFIDELNAHFNGDMFGPEKNYNLFVYLQYLTIIFLNETKVKTIADRTPLLDNLEEFNQKIIILDEKLDKTESDPLRKRIDILAKQKGKESYLSMLEDKLQDKETPHQLFKSSNWDRLPTIPLLNPDSDPTGISKTPEFLALVEKYGMLVAVNTLRMISTDLYQKFVSSAIVKAFDDEFFYHGGMDPIDLAIEFKRNWRFKSTNNFQDPTFTKYVDGLRDLCSDDVVVKRILQQIRQRWQETWCYIKTSTTTSDEFILFLTNICHERNFERGEQEETFIRRIDCFNDIYALFSGKVNTTLRSEHLKYWKGEMSRMGLEIFFEHVKQTHGKGVLEILDKLKDKVTSLTKRDELDKKYNELETKFKRKQK